MPIRQRDVYCGYCGTTHPATADYWYRDTVNGGLHLNARCRAANREYRAQLRNGASRTGASTAWREYSGHASDLNLREGDQVRGAQSGATYRVTADGRLTTRSSGDGRLSPNGILVDAYRVTGLHGRRVVSGPAARRRVQEQAITASWSQQETPLPAPAVEIEGFDLTDRRFGVEIEFIGDRHSVETALQDVGLEARVEAYNHTTRTWWKVTSDASVSGGGELVSPPLSGRSGRDAVVLACRALRASGASINSATGLHVHHEVLDLEADQIARAVRSYFESQRAFDELVQPSRRSDEHNGYCSPWYGEDIERLERRCASVGDLRSEIQHYGFNRFRTVNVSSYPLYGTIEFRQHGGTIRYDKILSWIALGQALFTAVSEGETITSLTAGDLITNCERFGLDAAAAAFLRRRAEAFRESVTA